MTVREFKFHTKRITEETGVVTIQAATLADAINSMYFAPHKFEPSGGIRKEYFEFPTIYQVDGETVKKGDLV